MEFEKANVLSPDNTYGFVLQTIATKIIEGEKYVLLTGEGFNYTCLGSGIVRYYTVVDATELNDLEDLYWYKLEDLKSSEGFLGIVDVLEEYPTPQDWKRGKIQNGNFVYVDADLAFNEKTDSEDFETDCAFLRFNYEAKCMVKKCKEEEVRVFIDNSDLYAEASHGELLQSKYELGRVA